MAPLRRHLLWVYWLACFLATHVPVPPSAEPFLIWDKAMHSLMYAGLASLFAWRFRAGWPALLILTGYAALDEVTQAFVGRTPDVLDWTADALGATCGLSVVALIRHRRRSSLN